MLAFDITTQGRCRMHDITGEVRRLLREALTQFPGPRSGALALFCPHTTCGLTINEGADPDVRRDMEGFFRRLVPQDPAFAHAEGNSDAHIKCTLHGPSLLVLVEDGELRLGTCRPSIFAKATGRVAAPSGRSGCPARADPAPPPGARRFSPAAKQAMLSFSLRAGRKAALTFSPACEVTYEHAP